jgi:hypothetical protein
MSRARWTRPAVAAWALFALALMLVAVGLILLALSWLVPVPPGWGFRGFTAIFAVVEAGVGVAIVTRRQTNPIGWLLLSAAVLSGIQLAAEEYAFYALLQRAGALPGGGIGAWIQGWIWPVGVALVAVYVPLLFPDGHFRSGRWKVVAGLGVLAVGYTAVLFTLKPGLVSGLATIVDNPFGLPGLAPTTNLLVTIGFTGLMSMLAASFLSVFLRFHQAGGVERQQLKWFAYASGLVVFALIVNTGAQVVELTVMSPDAVVLRQGEPIQKISQLGLIAAVAFLLVAIGIAIVRYRLYDIDLLINRTVVYGGTSAVVAATFFVGIVALQWILRPLTSGSELAVAASTLVSFALFQPIRRRVQDAIDRRFDRSRYDAARMLDAFADRLRDEVNLDGLRADLLGAVQLTMAPAHASLWLRERGR